MNKSVGAIIKNSEGRILLIERRKEPLGWAAPAGHMEEGESPEEAIIREVQEEVGFRVIDLKLVHNEFIKWNICSRGHNGHDWFVFELLSYTGDFKLEKREAKDYKWVDLNEFNEILEPAWQYIFKKLKYKD